jgi:hypothetical protein
LGACPWRTCSVHTLQVIAASKGSIVLLEGRIAAFEEHQEGALQAKVDHGAAVSPAVLHQLVAEIKRRSDIDAQVRLPLRPLPCLDCSACRSLASSEQIATGASLMAWLGQMYHSSLLPAHGARPSTNPEDASACRPLGQSFAKWGSCRRSRHRWVGDWML